MREKGRSECSSEDDSSIEAVTVGRLRIGAARCLAPLPFEVVRMAGPQNHVQMDPQSAHLYYFNSRGSSEHIFIVVLH